MADIEFSFRGTVKDGELVIEDKDIFLYHLLDFEGQQLGIKIKKWRNPRSVEQNAYYWGVVLAKIAGEIGCTPEEAHQDLTRMFLTYTAENGREYIRSTASLDTKQFTVYLDQVVEWAGRFLWLEIPPPTKDPWWRSLVAVKKLQTPDGWKFDPSVFEERHPITFKVDRVGLDREV